MEKITDWAKLWHSLVKLNNQRHPPSTRHDRWHQRARYFDDSVKKRWQNPDSSREFILSQLKPDSSFLDIGAGSGAWETLLTGRVRSITAVEPSSSMLEVLHETLSIGKINNVHVVAGAWPDVEVEVHDYSLASHAMYGCVNLPEYIHKMSAATRHTCFMIIRSPQADSIMTLAAQHVLGQPHDSPNFVIAYNVMLQMGLHPNVLMEEPGTWEPWTSESMDDALIMLKERLGLFTPGEHDGYLSALLKERLVYQGEKYIWDRGVRSVLVYWKGWATE